jgi:hypothetical protein
MRIPKKSRLFYQHHTEKYVQICPVVALHLCFILALKLSKLDFGVHLWTHKGGDRQVLCLNLKPANNAMIS